MDDGSVTSLGVLVGLILLHGLVELTYAALTNVRRPALKEQSEKGDTKAKRTLKLAEDVPHMAFTRVGVGFFGKPNNSDMAMVTGRSADRLCTETKGPDRQ